MKIITINISLFRYANVSPKTFNIPTMYRSNPVDEGCNDQRLGIGKTISLSRISVKFCLDCNISDI